MVLGELPVWFLRGFAIFFGLIWGSFLNVVIYRVPREMSVVRPGSHCPACGKPVAAYDNVPVLSFLILRGKARCCGAKMSYRYPLVELLGGVASVAILELCVRALPGDTTVIRALCIYLADFAVTLALIAAAFIDLEHMFLPDSINLGGAILGVATASFRGLSITDSLFGAVVGFGLVWLPFVFLYKMVRGRQGMGMGDAKLLLLAGAWFGWPGALWTLLAGATQGTVGAIVIWLLKGKIEEPESVKADLAELRKAAEEGDEEAKELLADDPLADPVGEGLGGARIAFGPFLILAFLELLLFRTELGNLARAYLFL